jgi:23S rRNA (cytidine1920-2'-O)/16S rRNA (cytidine1409-2'-O)-methyltransferase
VTVGGAPADKPSRQVDPGDAIEVLGPPARFVGRGGEKLAGALERFAVDPSGRRAIDCGASTGGFTDCLLQAGAREVVALDVGYGQLHERLRSDPRVRSFERTNLRRLDPDVVGGRSDLLVADLSFISLRTVADDLLRLALPGADLVLLVKPQFEAGREEAARGRGVITDPEVWRRALRQVVAAFTGRGAAIMDLMTSPIEGADGNVEFLAHFVTADGADASPTAVETLDDVAVDAMVSDLVAGAASERA